jgi:hypothetical protein
VPVSGPRAARRSPPPCRTRCRSPTTSWPGRGQAPAGAWCASSASCASCRSAWSSWPAPTGATGAPSRCPQRAPSPGPPARPARRTRTGLGARHEMAKAAPRASAAADAPDDAATALTCLAAGGLMRDLRLGIARAGFADERSVTVALWAGVLRHSEGGARLARRRAWALRSRRAVRRAGPRPGAWRPTLRASRHGIRLGRRRARTWRRPSRTRPRGIGQHQRVRKGRSP